MNVDLKKSYIKPHYSLVAMTLMWFVLVKHVVMASLGNIVFGIFVSITLSLLIFFSDVRNIKTNSANRLVIRGISTLFVVYVVFGAWSLPNTSQIASTDLIILVNILCIVFLLCSYKVEGLILPGLLLLLTHKQLVSISTQLPISNTDYMPLVEFGILLALVPVAVNSFKVVTKHFPHVSTPTLDDQLSILFVAVSVHSANYLFSAVQKLAISDPYWSWITNNPTHLLMISAYEIGSLPVSFIGDDFVQAIYSLLSSNVVLLNALMIAIQLSPLISLRSTKWLIVSMVLFDLTHIGIFILTGIFFYKWIVLNALIVAALIKIKDFQYSFQTYLSLVLGMILAPTIFFVAFLGWHDTPSFNDEHFMAHTKNGETFRVPTNFFLVSSVTYAQGRISIPKPGHFSTGPIGVQYNVLSSDPRWKSAANCDFTNENPVGAIDIIKITKRIRNHHKFILNKLDKLGRLEYDLFPHHIWSMPWSYRPFHALDKRKIIGYSYVIESKCLLQKTNQFADLEILKRTEKYIDVR